MKIILIASLSLITTACRQDMYDQPKVKPLSESDFFEDGRSSRPLVEGTVPRGYLKIDDHLYTGKVNGRLVNTFPFPIAKEVLDRGQERYNIFCSPCHDRAGYGRGIVVQRGFKAPPSFHIPRLQQAPVGHFFDVITNGFGAMFDYSDRVPVEDRWAIVAYIQALQLSQNVSGEELSPEQWQKVVGKIE